MKRRKGTSVDYGGSNGVLLMTISTVDPEKQRRKRCDDEEENEIWESFLYIYKMTLTSLSAN